MYVMMLYCVVLCVFIYFLVVCLELWKSLFDDNFSALSLRDGWNDGLVVLAAFNLATALWYFTIGYSSVGTVKPTWADKLG